MPQRVAGALAALTVLWGLRAVLSGDAWWLDVALVVVVVTVTGVGLGHLRARPLAVTGAQVAAALLVLTVVHAPAQAVGGLLPGPAVWELAVARSGEAAEAIRTQAAPVDAGAGLRLVVAAGAGVLVILVDVLAVAARRPALAGLPLLAVHATAVVFTPGGLGPAPFLVALAGFVLLLAVGREVAPGWGVVVAARTAAPQRKAVPVLVSVSALSVVAATLVALVAPPIVDLRTRPTLFTGQAGAGEGSPTSLDPLLDLRRNLGERQDTVVLRYTTDEERPQPLRVAIVDTLTGDLWEPEVIEDEAPLVAGETLPAIPGLAGDTPVTRYTMQASVGALRQQSLPVPYPADRVDVEGRWLFAPAGRTVVGAGNERTGEGQRYEVEYLRADVDQARLEAALAPPDAVVRRYTQLPADLPPVIARTAAEVVADQSTAYARAVALQEWFRGEGGFRYTLAAPDARSSSALADFLTDREGYCVHFASAMAVMARTLGIPARVAVGFLPGSLTTDGWQVTVRDAHAWPELYFEGTGWVRFEPTPATRSGQAPPWTVEQVAPSEAPEAAPGATAAPSVGPSPPPQQAAGRSTADTGTDGGGSSWPATAVVVLAMLCVILGILRAPRLARDGASRRRWRRARVDAERAEAAWADLLEQVGDLGLEVSVAATPRQTGQHLSELLAGAPDHSATTEGLGRLVGAVEHVRYGAPTPLDGYGSGGAAVLERPTRSAVRSLEEDGSAVVALLALVAPARSRRRWRWWPPSGRRMVVRALRRALRRLRGRQRAGGVGQGSR